MTEKQSTYFHINNGGVSFRVTNDNGPTIEMKASHFDNITNSMKIHVTRKGLEELGQMFLDASKMEFGEPYCCAAKTQRDHSICKCSLSIDQIQSEEDRSDNKE